MSVVLKSDPMLFETWRRGDDVLHIDLYKDHNDIAGVLYEAGFRLVYTWWKANRP